ncbi:25.3 kDa vesicle transport protein SEC22-1 [Nicotiana tabacum]|uniref:25.3 kDa vesicle transport protein n=1 Tax=Nicotiana tabacum TaxID=4097 RepID=A0A1S4A117_TOBAC|nr:25.3 kDa vesicle transport protein [Nicotiana tomentosiformis]XP_016470294.1 PREDICTED: 25.3 kDa vesicle transport protein-like [Nicotiana tabacum]
MVKLTIIGRVSDGMPLAQNPRFVQEENDVLTTYKQQAEFLLKEISLRALPSSKMTILVDHHCFNYIVENGICFLTLCESSYPRKLAFHYLEDLHQEFERLDKSLTDRITKPYTFIKLDTIIANIRKQYVDTRTQANLSKLNADRQKDLDIGTDELSLITERRRRLERMERLMVAHRSTSPIWESKRLEIIALKWTPITILLVVAAVLLWTGLILQDDFR